MLISIYRVENFNLVMLGQEAYEQALAYKAKLASKASKTGGSEGFFFDTLVCGTSSGGPSSLPEFADIGLVPMIKETALSIASVTK